MTPEAPTLAEFLLQRISEDEAMFRRAGVHWSEIEQYMLPGFTEERALAECTAHREIIEQHRKCEFIHEQGHRSAYATGERAAYQAVLQLLAQPYRDHPDFAPAWSVAEPLESP